MNVLRRNPKESEVCKIMQFEHFWYKHNDKVATLKLDSEEVAEVVAKIERNDPNVKNKYIIENKRLYKIIEERWRLLLHVNYCYNKLKLDISSQI